MQATSKLLVNYPDKERNEILDYLFKVCHFFDQSVMPRRAWPEVEMVSHV